MKIIELSSTKILCYLVRLLRKFWISYQLSKTSKHRNVFYQTIPRKHKINVSECTRHATYLLYDEYLVVCCVVTNVQWHRVVCAFVGHKSVTKSLKRYDIKHCSFSFKNTNMNISTQNSKVVLLIHI